MTFTKTEKHMVKQDWLKLAVTTGIYYLWGNQLATIVQSLDAINQTAANIIVFGAIGCTVYMLIAWVD